jgi:hypothetical protein
MRTLIVFLGAAAVCRGQSVEFIGFEQSNPKVVEATLDRLPNGAIHYCAADLKKAGFADASVNIYVANDRSLFTVVAVVEGSRAADIHYREPPTEDLRAPVEWNYDNAVRLLSGAHDVEVRVAAAKALKSFSENDGAWRALAACLRDADFHVSEECRQSLSGLRREAPRKVDWAPAEADLSALLRGTNLFGFMELVQTLTATSIDPAMAAPLLRNGGARLVLAHFEARHDPEHAAAHALLAQLRGDDLGDRAALWQSWLAAL